MRIIDAFFGLRDWRGLWLTGGTCLAEYDFGHRTSVDVDLFTAGQELFDAARDVLRRPASLGNAGALETLRTDIRMCQFLVHAGQQTVKLDLVLDVPVMLGEKLRVGCVWLDSLPDDASNKMGRLMQRENAKDYIDLYYLLPHLGIDTRQAVELGRRKDAGIDPLLLAAQIRFIESQGRPDYLRTDVPWANVRYFFRRMREDLLRSIAPPPA